MNKREAQEAERARIAEAADRNARPILRVYVLDGRFHVVGLTVSGKVFHERFSSLEAANLYIKEVAE